MADRLIVRTDQETLERWTRHAKAEGKTLSDWVRLTLDNAVSSPVLRPGDHLSVQFAGTASPAPIPNRKLTASEIAAMIPGVQVGVGAEPMEMGPEWVEAVEEREALPIFDWRGRFARWKARGDAGEEEKREYLQGMALPVQFWQKKNEAAWILWLEENRPNG